MVNQTLRQYDEIIADCRKIYADKIKDYGTSWRVLRPRSLTDQIFIKAQRIKTIEEKGVQKVNEDIADEFKGIINYSIISLIQLDLGNDDKIELKSEQALSLYDEKVELTRSLMIAKNHDYGEAWRDMRESSFTDLILMKLLRLRQIEDNDGKTLISEGSASHYQDILNYSVFALIKMSEKV